ncbi:MAG: helix-turn-helix domain-containing protein [Halieaceae bacterium]|nr:helix-turn-helix domain-containing protein [Halieaceae bacterium]
MRAAEFVQSYFDAWNHSDAKGVAEHLEKDGTYLDVPTNEQYSREDLIANLVDFFTYEKPSYELIGEVLASEGTIAFQYRMFSEDSDDWYGAEFMSLEGDSVIKIVDYWNPTHLETQPAMVSAPKYVKSGLNSDQMEKYTNQLSNLMNNEKAYLEPDLTMPKLASLVGCSVNHLSQAVNSGFGMNFFDFLNRYRVEAAQEMLSLNDSQSQAILDISFAVGFNSNSAFYAAFKKATGQTPAQFRRTFLAKNSDA